MTPDEAVSFVQETERIADANHRRALDLYDLVFPPWRWPKWVREYRAIRATMSETQRRNAVSRKWLHERSS